MQRRVDGGIAWLAVGCAFVAHFVGFGIIYSFTVFFPSILTEFGEGRGQTSWIPSIAAGLMLGAGGVTGRLSDHFGPGRVVAAGGMLIGLGLSLSSVASSIWQVYVAYGLVFGVGVSCAFVPSVATVGGWFERKRGLAIGIAVAGTGIGSLTLAPLSSALIDEHGWRVAMRALAIGGAVALVAVGSVLRPRLAAMPRGRARDVARGNRVFALLFWSSVIASYGYWVPFVHIVPYAEDHGLSKASAASIVAIMGVANTGGRVLMGGLADRVGRHRMMRVSALALSLALLAWPLAGSWLELAGFGVLYGLFAGAFIALLPALAGDYFGLERLGSITGLLFSGAAIGTLFGAPVTGMLFDANGDYTLGIVIAAATMAAGTVLLYLLPDPKLRAAVAAEAAAS